MKCPKCNNEMVKGVFQIPQGFVLVTEMRFVPEVVPQSSWIKKSDNKSNSFCCTGCGYVETYLVKE